MGKPYFYTSETLLEVMQYLDRQKIPYSRRDSAKMLIITHPHKKWKRYDYRWSTGRWCPLPNKLNKHYSSRNIQDFVSRFLKPHEGGPDEHP